MKYYTFFIVNIKAGPSILKFLIGALPLFISYILLGVCMF